MDMKWYVKLKLLLNGNTKHIWKMLELQNPLLGSRKEIQDTMYTRPVTPSSHATISHIKSNHICQMDQPFWKIEYEMMILKAIHTGQKKQTIRILRKNSENHAGFTLESFVYSRASAVCKRQLG